MVPPTADLVRGPPGGAEGPSGAIRWAGCGRRTGCAGHAARRGRPGDQPMLDVRTAADGVRGERSCVQNRPRTQDDGHWTRGRVYRRPWRPSPGPHPRGSSPAPPGPVRATAARRFITSGGCGSLLAAAPCRATRVDPTPRASSRAPPQGASSHGQVQEAHRHAPRGARGRLDAGAAHRRCLDAAPVGRAIGAHGGGPQEAQAGQAHQPRGARSAPRPRSDRDPGGPGGGSPPGPGAAAPPADGGERVRLLPRHPRRDGLATSRRRPARTSSSRPRATPTWATSGCSPRPSGHWCSTPTTSTRRCRRPGSGTSSGSR